MRYTISRTLCLVASLFAVEQSAADMIGLTYQATSLGGTRWQYTYGLANFSLNPPVTEFTIWFDVNTYRNLVVATSGPLAANWNELVTQPDPFIHADGFYDALATTGGIAPGNINAGFSVTFDWLGVGQPGPQRFEVVDSVSFTVRYSGTSVPEPSASVLVLLAAPVLLVGRFPFGSISKAAA